jgi:hypothetical protein
MATFCLITGMSPTEFRKLTLAEYKAFIEAIEERAGT